MGRLSEPANNVRRLSSTIVFACRGRQPARDTCKFCPELSVALCDHRKPGSRRTCSARMCDQHRTRVGPDLDVCPDHKAAEALPLGPMLHVAATQMLPGENAPR